MNGNRKRKAKKDMFKQWRRERDEAVMSLDVEKFKAFCLKWQALGAYEKKPLPPDNIVEISMYKMACEITTIPEDIALKAALWLVRRGYVPAVQWGKEETEETENDGTDEG